MKILFISQDYYPQISGVPVVVQYLAEGLKQKGYEVSVATCRRKENPYNENINGVCVYRFDIYQNVLKRPAGCIDKYIEFVCNFECDIIIFECTECITTDLLLPYLYRIQAKKILHAHGFSGLCSIKQTKILKICDDVKHTIGHPYNWLRSWYYFNYWLPRYIQDFDSSMVLSDVDSAKAYLDSYLGYKNFVLENAADDIFFQEYSSDNRSIKDLVKLKSSRFCFSCANYSYIKNQKKMIEQFFKSSVEDLALVCVGRTDNAYYYECKQLIKELEKQYGSREIHLLFGIDRSLIPIIESQASIYLVSSITEQYSISIIEAMAQGVPFISTNVGNARVLPGGITLDSVENMYQAIRLLISNKKQYANLSYKGKKYANTYNRKQNAVDRLEEIIYKTFNDV